MTALSAPRSVGFVPVGFGIRKPQVTHICCVTQSAQFSSRVREGVGMGGRGGTVSTRQGWAEGQHEENMTVSVTLTALGRLMQEDPQGPYR